MKSKKKMGYDEGSNRLLSCRLLCFGTILAKVPQHHACHHFLYSSGSLNTHKDRMSVVASFYHFFWPEKGRHFFLANETSIYLAQCTLLSSYLLFQTTDLILSVSRRRRRRRRRSATKCECYHLCPSLHSLSSPSDLLLFCAGFVKSFGRAFHKSPLNGRPC